MTQLQNKFALRKKQVEKEAKKADKLVQAASVMFKKYQEMAE